VSEEADKNYFLKGILAIFLGKRTSDDPHPTCVQALAPRPVVAVQDSKVQRWYNPLDCGLLRDGLVVGGFDLVVGLPVSWSDQSPDLSHRSLPDGRWSMIGLLRAKVAARSLVACPW